MMTAHRGGVAHTTLPASGTSAGSKSSDVGYIPLIASAIHDGRPDLYGPYSSQPSIVEHDIQTGPGSPELYGPYISISQTVRIPLIAFSIHDGRLDLYGPYSSQPNHEPQLPLYIEASINPLPSDYGFLAAPATANLQHGHVNPLPKETLHHG